MVNDDTRNKNDHCFLCPCHLPRKESSLHSFEHTSYAFRITSDVPESDQGKQIKGIHPWRFNQWQTQVLIFYFSFLCLLPISVYGIGLNMCLPECCLLKLSVHPYIYMQRDMKRHIS